MRRSGTVKRCVGHSYSTVPPALNRYARPHHFKTVTRIGELARPDFQRSRFRFDRVRSSQGILRRTGSAHVGAAGMDLRAGLEFPLFVDGRFGLVGMARGGDQVSAKRLRFVRGPVGSERTLELAVLFLAQRRRLLSGSRGALGPDPLHARCLLAHSNSCRNFTSSLLGVGDVRNGPVFCRLEDESRGTWKVVFGCAASVPFFHGEGATLIFIPISLNPRAPPCRKPSLLKD